MSSTEFLVPSDAQHPGGIFPLSLWHLVLQQCTWLPVQMFPSCFLPLASCNHSFGRKEFLQTWQKNILAMKFKKLLFSKNL